MPRKRTCRTAALCIRRIVLRAAGWRHLSSSRCLKPLLKPFFNASSKSFFTRKRESSAHPMKFTPVGHRVVHGGSHFAASTRITPEVEKTIEQCAPLAPLHNPFNLRGIRACQTILPDIPHVAVFDTAFHQTIPDYAHTYALPHAISEQYQIRQYGFPRHIASIRRHACSGNARLALESTKTDHLPSGQRL